MEQQRAATRRCRPASSPAFQVEQVGQCDAASEVPDSEIGAFVPGKQLMFPGQFLLQEWHDFLDIGDALMEIQQEIREDMVFVVGVCF